jgi:hypothetical protein
MREPVALLATSHQSIKSTKSFKIGDTVCEILPRKMKMAGAWIRKERKE